MQAFGARNPERQFRINPALSRVLLNERGMIGGIKVSSRYFRPRLRGFRKRRLTWRSGGTLLGRERPSLTAGNAPCGAPVPICSPAAVGGIPPNAPCGAPDGGIAPFGPNSKPRPEDGSRLAVWTGGACAMPVGAPREGLLARFIPASGGRGGGSGTLPAPEGGVMVIVPPFGTTPPGV